MPPGRGEARHEAPTPVLRLSSNGRVAGPELRRRRRTSARRCAITQSASSSFSRCSPCSIIKSARNVALHFVSHFAQKHKRASQINAAMK
jgi:hypothetical protein